MEENNWKLEDFSVEETKDEWSISSSINVVNSENVKPIIWFKSKGYSVEWIIYEERENVIYTVQSETKKYLWFSVDRYRKSSPFSYCVLGLVGVHKGQDQQSNGPPRKDHQWKKWRFTSCRSRCTLVCISGRDGGVLRSRIFSNTRIKP